MRCFVFLMLLLPLCCLSQSMQQDGREKPNMDTVIDPHIFRIVLTQPIGLIYEGNAILTFQYEYTLANRLSFVAKAGPGISSDNFGDDGTWRAAYYAFVLVEGRYYYSQGRRLRKGRPIYNHTGPYVGLDLTAMSAPFLYVNKGNTKKPFAAGLASYLNIGYQKQFGRLYLHASLGALMGGTRYSDYADDRYAASFHGGLSVGFMF